MMKTFPMTCTKCGRKFECDGHCANLSGLEDSFYWYKKTDEEIERFQKECGEWNHPKRSVCTCDFCKNRLVDKNGKPCNNHCEPDMEVVQFT